MSFASSAGYQDRPRYLFRAAHVNQSIRTMLTVVPVILVDLVSLTLAMGTAHLILRIVSPEIDYAISRQLLPLLAVAAAVFPICGAYALCGLNPSKEFREIACANLFTFAVLLVANMMLANTTTEYEIKLILLSLGISLLLHPLIRGAGRAYLGRCSWWGWPVLVVGDHGHRDAVLNHLNNNLVLGMRPMAVIGEADFEAADSRPDRERLAHSLVQIHRANHVVLAISESDPASMRDSIDLWASCVNNVIVVLSVPNIPTLWTDTQDYGGMLGLHARAKLLSPWRLLLKRTMDLTLIVVAAPLLLPIFAVISVLVKWFSPGPIFYGHERIGRDWKKFKAWKFRSMIPNADAVLQTYLEEHPELREEWERDHKLKNDPRIIPGIGAVIRQLSLDELPQLWNVVRGEMSLVGPRPIVDAEIDKYRDTFPLYLKVTPGITGLWQISGRNNTTYEERITLDAYYVRNWSPWLDSYILARTVKTVLLREGAF